MLFFRPLEYAVQATPLTYHALVAHPGGTPRRTMPTPPSDKRVRSDSLARSRATGLRAAQDPDRDLVDAPLYCAQMENQFRDFR